MPRQNRLFDMTVGVCSHGLPCCVGNNTKIYTNHGVLNIQDYEEGIKLWSSNGWQKPLSFHKHKYTGKLIELKLMGLNDKLLLTPDHPLLISKYKQCPFRGGGRRCFPRCKDWHVCNHDAKNYFNNCEWVEAQDINHKDYCIYPINSSLNDVEHSINDFNIINNPNINDSYYFLGIWFAEGCSDNSKNPEQVQISLNKNKTDILEKIKPVIEGLNVNLRTYNQKNSNAISVRFNSKKMANSLLTLFGSHGATQKSIPKTFLMKDKNKIISFLLGWYHGDGWSDNSNYYIVTSSKEAAYFGQFLFWWIGIPATLKQYNNYKPYSYKINQCNDRYHIGWSIRQSKLLTHDNKIFVPVNQKNVINYDDYVYNFTMNVNDNPEFCIPVLSHNCPHG